jgi:general secretion pathway protein G
MVKNLCRNPRRGAFTLLEILIAISLLALLATIVVSTHRNAARKSKETVLKHNLQQIRLALDHYNNDKGHYPADLGTLVDEGYIREIPTDPITGSKETWQLVYDNARDEDSSYEVGIFDIHSGSEDTAIDGTYYYEW